MRIFPAPLEIGDEDGFGEGKDLFQRASLGQGLANLVGSVEDPMVLAIDGQWGSGKTTFLKMWAGQLRQQGFPVIYFDAFENDYSEDAFTALAAEIIGLLDAEKKRGEPQGKAFLTKAIGAGKVLARSALKIGVKAATMGALSGSDVEDLADAVSDETEEFADKYIGELLTKQSERRDTLHAFKDALRDLPGILAPASAPGEDEQQAAQKPLVFIIDELDRCRPLFALQMLERIKHFFSVKNLHFVLGTHMGQLEACVRAAYGEGIDAHLYLQKFIQITYHLPERSRRTEQLNSAKYISSLVDRLDFPSADRDLLSAAVGFIVSAARNQTLSFRTIERIMTSFALGLSFTKENEYRPAPIIAGLCVLRVTAPELYRRAKKGILQFDEVDKFFDFKSVDDTDRTIFSTWSISYWRFCTDKNAEEDLINRFSQGLWQYNFGNRSDVVPYVANLILDRLEAPV